MRPEQNRTPGHLVLLLTISVLATTKIAAQTTDSTATPGHFGGSIAVTNNGISLIPSFSLNKPAALLVMNVGRRLSFDPEFRFSMEGKPWSFVFWWRYKIIQTGRFRLSAGAHPAFLFRSTPAVIGGNTQDVITAERYLAAEVAPSYYITKNATVGMYFLRATGLTESGVKASSFVTVNAGINRIPLSKKYNARFNPQIFYLRMDDKDGYYATSTFTLERTGFPLSLQNVINKTIKTNIPSKHVLWNISLIYSFRKEYQPRPGS